MSYAERLQPTRIRVTAKLCNGGAITETIALKAAHDQAERNRQIANALHAMQDAHPNALHVTAEGGR